MSAPAAMVDAPRQRRGSEIIGSLLLFACLAPNIAWVLLDRGLWTSDTAYYGLEALQLNDAWTAGVGPWWLAMLSVVPKPPGLPWAAQFLVPLGQAIGHVETGLLGVTLVAHGLALLLLYRAIHTLAHDRWIAIIACLSVAASPAFTGMSKQLYAQPFQLVTVSWFVFIMARAKGWDSLRTLLHLLGAASLACLTTLSTPSACVLPGLVALAIAMGRLKHGVRIHRGQAPLIMLTLGLGAVSGAWYRVNSVAAFEYAGWAYDYVYSGALGSLYLSRLSEWLSSGYVGLMPVALFIAPVLGVGVFLRRVDPHRADGRFTWLAATCVLQAGLVLGLFALSVNHESRYVLVLAPYLAVALAWVLARIDSHVVTFVVALILAGEWTGAQLTDYGVRPVFEPFVRSLQLSPGRDAETLHFVSDLTRHEPGPHVLATHQIGFHNLQLAFEAAKNPDYDHGLAPHVDQVEFLLTRDGVEGDAGKAWTHVQSMTPTLIVIAERTLQRERLHEADGGWRLVLEATLAVSEEVARSAMYARVQAPLFPELEIYRHVSQ